MTTKKEYCLSQLDVSDDKKKSLERSVSDEEKSIAITEDAIATTIAEIDALTASIAALDKSVVEATEQRKDENAEYKDRMASDSAAKELLEFAKNRLNKFYNPKLYKAPPKQELSAENRIFVAEGGSLPTAAAGGIAGTGISAAQVAPPPPPETVGPYQTKSRENAGVIDMINILINDLDKDMTEAETIEKDAQEDYAVFMEDSAQQRADDSKTLTDKEAAKAALEADLQAHKAEKEAFGKELAATLEYIA